MTDETAQPDRAVILVAEDDPVTAKIVVYRLSRDAGMDVIQVADGEAALDVAAHRTLAAAILDIRLPGLDGLGVLARLRQSARHQRLPIIMLTSLGTETDIIRGFELGADDYVVKPFSPAELVARLHRLLRRRRPTDPA
ncbi:MAG: response regulator [Gemmatimonadota bacterium]|nr:response regulator [Gemmatimonadota bacterium]